MLIEWLLLPVVFGSLGPQQHIMRAQHMPNVVEFNPFAHDGHLNARPACEHDKAESLGDRMADRSDTLSHRRGLASTQCSGPAAVHAQVAYYVTAFAPPMPTPATGVWQSGQ